MQEHPKLTLCAYLITYAIKWQSGDGKHEPQVTSHIGLATSVKRDSPEIVKPVPGALVHPLLITLQTKVMAAIYLNSVFCSQLLEWSCLLLLSYLLSQVSSPQFAKPIAADL